MKGNELKPHIGIFGRRNYGKSSLVNYLTGQNIAIVSDMAGTTTDPVKKTMEIGGVGPVVWIDTAGIDDEGTVGRMRIDRSLEMLSQVDLALLLFTNNRFEAEEVMLVESCRKRAIPYILIYSQADRMKPDLQLVGRLEADYETKIFVLTVRDLSLRDSLTARIREALPETAYVHKSLLGDVVGEGDTVLMVTPIDSSAPEGRMILPQVQVLRDILDIHARAVVCRETELQRTLDDLLAAKVKRLVVITDSQVYHLVSKVVPDDIYLTSFSVVLARAKGPFKDYVQGTPFIENLRDGDRVLMLESCTHNVTCEDIGRVKLPKLLANYTGKQLHCEAVAGLAALQRPITDYALVIQCGGCVATAKQMAARLAPAIAEGVPVSNYGLAIAYMNGIFERSMRIFTDNMTED